MSAAGEIDKQLSNFEWQNLRNGWENVFKNSFFIVVQKINIIHHRWHCSPDLKIKQHEVLIGCNSADSGPLIEYLLHHNNNNSPSGQEIKTNLGRKHFHEKKKEREKKDIIYDEMNF